jgi:hypothetical protein
MIVKFCHDAERIREEASFRGHYRRGPRCPPSGLLALVQQHQADEHQPDHVHHALQRALLLGPAVCLSIPLPLSTNCIEPCNVSISYVATVSALFAIYPAETTVTLQRDYGALFPPSLSAPLALPPLLVAATVWAEDCAAASAAATFICSCRTTIVSVTNSAK